MQRIQRRSFLAFAFAALPKTARAQSNNSDRRTAALRVVPAEADRFGRPRPIPTGSSTFKVASQDSGGALFVMEQRNTVNGGPALHLHRHEDELFYVVEGDYIVQVGSQQHRMQSGDCILGPGEVPHTWALWGRHQDVC